MAQTNYTPISLYYSTTASAVPTAANLVPGELAINTNDGKLYYEDSSGVVQVLATKSTGSIGGSNTQVQFNNSGSLGGSSGLTWDGSFLTTSSIKNSALTSGRVTYATTSGLLTDSANLLYSGADLTVYGLTVGRGTSAISTNTALGVTALLGINSGVGFNTAIGYQALKANTSGVENTVAGGNAGLANTSGSYNSIFGTASFVSNLSGASNTGVGHNTLGTNTTGSSNTAIGRDALQANFTASYNTAVGYQAGYTNVTGAQVTYVGQGAGVLATGSNNTFIGAPAGSQITTGAKNTILGGYSGNFSSLDIRTANNYIVLSDGDGNVQQSSYNGGTTALQGAVPNSGTGITFPATQSASSNANTLDDYEEGTWTPTIIAAGGSGSPTYSSNTGNYTKIGNTVIATAFIAYTKNTLSGGVLQSGGLPFTSNATYLPQSACYITAGSLITNPICQVSNAGTLIDILKSNVVTGAVGSVAISDLGAGSLELRYTVTYYV